MMAGVIAVDKGGNGRFALTGESFGTGGGGAGLLEVDVDGPAMMAAAILILVGTDAGRIVWLGETGVG